MQYTRREAPQDEDGYHQRKSDVTRWGEPVPPVFRPSTSLEPRHLVAREEFGYRWDRGIIWLERVIDFAGKTGLGWGFLQFAIPI